MNGFPISEIFGPTIQGEGPLIGRPTHFVRFGGCDYRCEWCDTLYAVDPEHVRLMPRLTEDEILDRIGKLRSSSWVTLSGGNPTLYDLSRLISLLREKGYRVAVETQGSHFRKWLKDCQMVVISPKPPSSGMTVDLEELHRHVDLNPLDSSFQTIFKIVIFTEEDYQWAKSLRDHFGMWGVKFYLQPGNRVGHDSASALIEKLTLIGEWVIRDLSDWRDAVTILPQLHVLMWGNSRGK